MKNPENKKQWIIEPYAAGVVRDIFQMCLEGKSNETIAKILEERQVLVPMNAINKDIHFFSCSNYVKDYRGTCATRHYIREDAVEQVVMMELQRMATFLTHHEDEFVKALERKTNADSIREKKVIEADLQKAIVRNERVASLYEKLYEDNAEGKVTDEWFMQLSHRYEVERMELKSKIVEYKDRLRKIAEDNRNKESFISAVRKFMEMKKLTPALLRELIDKIEVHETEGVGKHRTQRIIIHYRFIGFIEMPDCVEQARLTAETSKG